jgi:hypothetical protein
MVRKLALAASIAGSFGAMNANAVDYELFLGGATALDTAVRRLVVIDVCASNIEKYQNSAIGFTYRCTPKPGLNGINPATDRVVILKNTVAGSFTGIREVRNSIASFLKPPSPLSLGTSACGAGVAGTEFGIPITTFTCTGNGGTGAPDAGFSDVEPRIFDFNPNFVVGPTSPAPFGPSWANGLNSVAAFSQAFGFPVSDKAYRVLQIAQGKCASLANCAAVDPSFGETLAPSLNIADVRGMFTGTLTDWSGIDANRSSGASAIANAAIAAGLDTAVKVCRRAETSGTQASYNVLVEGFPCLGSAAAIFASNAVDGCTVNGATLSSGTAINQGGYIGDGTYPNVTLDQCKGSYTVVVGNGASNVDTCLTKADLFNEMAIGTIGLDRSPNDPGASGTGDDPDGAPDAWHYVKANDVYPSLTNIAFGKYELMVESTFNRRSAGNGAAYSVQKTAMMDKLQNSSADPTNPLPGVFSLPSRGFNWDGIAPVIKAERGGNSCSPLLTTF